MGLLFLGGVMNLLWVAALAIFVLLEKLAPFDGPTGRILSGVAAIAVGLFVIASAF
jgi:predicted metal-binding membrane protein